MEKFHEMMRRKREEHGFSQYELAEQIGVQQPTVNHIEKGRRKPSFELLMRICAVLDIPLPWRNEENDKISRAGEGEEDPEGPESE